MWAEQASRASKALNYAATLANTKFESSYKMWYGTTAKLIAVCPAGAP